MALNLRSAAVFDENAVQNQNGPSITKPLLVANKQRAALGDMVNRNKNPTVGLTKQDATANKNLALKEINRNKIESTTSVGLSKKSTSNLQTTSTISQTNLREIKPRVDTHWKRLGTQATTTTTAGAASKATKKTTISETTKLTNLKSGIIIEKTRAKIIETDHVLRPAAQRIQVRPPIRKDTIKSSIGGSKIGIVSTTSKVVATQKPKTSTGSLQNVAVKIEGTKNIIANEPLQLVYNDGIEFDDKNGCISHSTLLLNDIQNIDENDEGNLVLVSEYVNDIYSYMYNLEMEFPIKPNFLEKHVDVTPKMRAVLMDWINEVHYQYKLLQETFFMAVAIIDRYLQIVTTIKRSNLQLVGVTALFIASKYEELYPPEIKDFVYITDETYNRNQILEMERHIVKKLDFQLGRPLPNHFLRRYSKAANSEEATHQMAKYFLELMSIQYSYAHYRPSEMAGAALLLAEHLTTHEPINKIWNQTLQYYSTHSTSTLLPIVERLADTVKSVETDKLRAVFNKYNSKRFNEIALYPQLNSAKIDALCSKQ